MAAPLKSMTGFAAVARDIHGGRLAIELKSVNHRYLEFQARLPDEMRALEATLRELVAAALSRGKVDCRVSFSPAAVQQAPLLSEDALTALAESQQAILRRFEARPLSVWEILHAPGVVPDSAVDAEAIREDAIALMKAAVAELDATRVREGAKLAQLIIERLDGIDALVREVAPVVPQLVAAYREKLSQKLAEAMAGGLDDERLKQEVVLFASRIDVAEELNRLSAHTGEVRRVLTAGGAAGKRLDFLMQELNREANTLGSKSVSTESTRVSVELKVLIEQMREQIQNVE